MARGAVLAGFLLAAPPATADGFYVWDPSSPGWNGFLADPWKDALRLDFGASFPDAIAGASEGVSRDTSLGFRFDVARLSAYLGLRYRSIDPDPLLDPIALDDDADAGDVRISGEAGLFTELSGRWDASLAGSYAHGAESYWIRLRPGYRTDSGIRWGPELMALGGDQSRQRIGLFTSGYRFLGEGTFGFDAGAEHDSRDNQFEPYFGASFSYRF